MRVVACRFALMALLTACGTARALGTDATAESGGAGPTAASQQDADGPTATGGSNTEGRDPPPATEPADVPQPPLREPTPAWRYLIGIAVIHSPVYAGSKVTEVRVQPVVALRFGRFRIAPARAGALAEPDDSDSAGASALLRDSKTWRVGVSLRVDSGRSSSDDPILEGLPDIDRTLRARLFARYRITDHWALGANVSGDLLDRQGGATGSIDITRRLDIAPGWNSSIGAGIGLADAHYTQLYYGVPESAAIPGVRAAYSPGGGVRDVHAGAGASTALAPNWRIGVAASFNRLVGDSASSPLVEKPYSYGLMVGVAYVY